MNALARMFPGVRVIPPPIREGAEPVSHGYCKPCADEWRRVNLPPKREAL